MFAVLQTGGKQYRVKEGDHVKVEKLVGDVGATITFDKVLLVGEGAGAKIGKPLVSGAAVEAEIVRQDRHPKVYYFRTQEEGWDRIRGHRQSYTEVRITAVKGA